MNVELHVVQQRRWSSRRLDNRRGAGEDRAEVALRRIRHLVDCYGARKTAGIRAAGEAQFGVGNGADTGLQAKPHIGAIHSQTQADDVAVTDEAAERHLAATYFAREILERRVSAVECHRAIGIRKTRGDVDYVH